jgi:hypothetical protein
MLKFDLQAFTEGLMSLLTTNATPTGAGRLFYQLLPP